jgi:hypothetical protein
VGTKKTHELTVVGLIFVFLLVGGELSAAPGEVRVTGKFLDAKTATPLAGRLYISGSDERWHFPGRSDANDVVVYERQNYWDKSQVEMHATVAAKPFSVDLPPGEYTVTVERGKEYLPLTKKLTVDKEHAQWRLPLTRWIDMAARGWYSGDVHCHRPTAELANLMLAEDLNVCLPITYWTTNAELPPSGGDKTDKNAYPAAPVAVDATHVWYPRNTEYEIFKVGGKPHTLGAFLILNHRSAFDEHCLPLATIAKRAHADGALIDLEKHNWEWAAVVAPVLPVDLFELANNHNWRIGFGVKNWGAQAPEWMKLQGPRTIDNEVDWLEYGWQFYYALLNSGLTINPAAGSASGAHPVPLGYSRVYVHLPDGFNFNDWMKGLKAGRSFVTTGPMLLVTVNDKDPGDTFKSQPPDVKLQVNGEAFSSEPLERIEIIWNGEVSRSVPPQNQPANNGLVTKISESILATASGWVAVRCVGKTPDSGGIPFAHSAPWHVEVAGKRLRPKPREVEYFLGRVEEEIDRNRSLLKPDQLADYYAARDFWRQKLDEARDESSSSK